VVFLLTSGHVVFLLTSGHVVFLRISGHWNKWPGLPDFSCCNIPK
jgi:hypothetical protein